jgi:hypothetical protein
MIQVIIDINSMEKWDALNPILESLDIDWIIKDTDTEVSLNKTEHELLDRAKEDIKEGRLFPYRNHREILAR